MEKEIGLYFRPDFTEYITQSFVNRYKVDTRFWIPAHAYYSQKNETADRVIPDGSYVLVGHVEYNNGACYHKIGQFIGIQSAGINWLFSHKFDYYPNSKGVELDPVFALMRVGEVREFKKVGVIIEDLRRRHFSEREIAKEILQYHPDTIESKVYRLRLALQRQMI